MVVMLITLALITGEIQTDSNLLVVPMPNMAVCKEMQEQSFIVDDESIYTFSIACVDLDDSEGF